MCNVRQFDEGHGVCLYNASCNRISQGGRGNSNCFIGGLDSEIFTGLNYYQRLLVLQGLSNELG